MLHGWLAVSLQEGLHCLQSQSLQLVCAAAVSASAAPMSATVASAAQDRAEALPKVSDASATPQGAIKVFFTIELLV